MQVKINLISSLTVSSSYLSRRTRTTGVWLKRRWTVPDYPHTKMTISMPLNSSFKTFSISTSTSSTERRYEMHFQRGKWSADWCSKRGFYTQCIQRREKKFLRGWKKCMAPTNQNLDTFPLPWCSAKIFMLSFEKLPPTKEATIQPSRFSARTACCSFSFPLFLKLGCLLQIGVYEKRHDDIRVYEVRRRPTGSAPQRNPFSILQLRESSGAYRQVRAQPVQCKGKHMSSTLQDIFAVQLQQVISLLLGLSTHCKCQHCQHKIPGPDQQYTTAALVRHLIYVSLAELSKRSTLSCHMLCRPGGPLIKVTLAKGPCINDVC